MRRTFQFGDRQCTVSVVPRDQLYEGIDGATFSIADHRTAQYMSDTGARHRIQSGEVGKSWAELQRVLGNMLASDLTRDSWVIGVGGGVICDLSALAASLYMRGVGLILVPTTLLAMVDAAVGGKTGVNFGGFKNMIGTFYPADEVRICTETLATLSDREYRSGLAEVIKTALLGDERLLDVLERERERVLSRDPALLDEIVSGCVEVKGAIVEADLRESGIRAHLNLGHTFAHALESVQGLGAWTHGEAVAWGMVRAAELAAAAGISDPEYAGRVRRLIESYEYRVGPLPEAAAAVRDAMRKDKKRRGDTVRFVLQRGPQDTIVTEVDERIVDAVLAGTS